MHSFSGEEKAFLGCALLKLTFAAGMAQFSNWEEVEKAVADTVLREEAGGWVVVGYHGTDKTVSFVGEGTKGVEELKRVITDDQFYYALIRVANPKELAHSHKASCDESIWTGVLLTLPCRRRTATFSLPSRGPRCRS